MLAPKLYSKILLFFNYVYMYVGEYLNILVVARRSFFGPLCWSCKWLWAIWCGCWEPNPDLLQEQYELSTTEPSLHQRLSLQKVRWNPCGDPPAPGSTGLRFVSDLVLAALTTFLQWSYSICGTVDTTRKAFALKRTSFLVCLSSSVSGFVKWVDTHSPRVLLTWVNSSTVLFLLQQISPVPPFAKLLSGQPS